MAPLENAPEDPTKTMGGEINPAGKSAEVPEAPETVEDAGKGDSAKGESIEYQEPTSTETVQEEEEVSAPSPSAESETAATPEGEIKPDSFWSKLTGWFGKKEEGKEEEEPK